MTSRTEGDQLDQSWRATTEGSPLATMDLGPLREEESIQLITQLMESSGQLATNLLKRAAGNPLFLEQLLHNEKEGTVENLPDSIQSLVHARLDRLAAPDKQALQAAAVIGQRFDLETLSYLLGVQSYNPELLTSHTLVRPEGERYLFSHALVQEGVYQSLLKSQRRQLHRRLADWFAGNDLVLHAEHLAHAGDEGAPQAFLEAANEQAQQYRIERALELVKRGLAAASESDHFALRCLEGELSRDLGSAEASIAAFRRAAKLAVDDEERCRALIGLAESLRFTEELDEELSTLEMAERLATAYQLSPELSHLYQMRASAHFFRGETEQCLEAATAALEHARIAGNPRLEARALSFRADAEYLGARMVTAHGYYTQCLELAREHGFGRVIASNLGQRGNTAWYKADVREAVDDSLEAAELCVKVHDQRAEMNAWVSAGIFIAWSGDVDEGERLVWRGIEVARSIESAFFHSYVFAVGRIAAQCGKFDEAERLAAEGVEILRSTQSGMTFLGPCALGVLARTTKDPKRRDAALGEAETLLAGGSVSHNYLEFYPDAIETALQIGDWPEAERYAQALEDYSSGQPLPLSTFYVNRGRGLAAHGRGNHDESTRDWLKELHDQATRIPLQWTLPALEQALRAYD